MTEGTMAVASSAYLHVPFCTHRCGYCDFTLVAGRNDLIGTYLSAIEKELATVNDQPKLETLYLGGGTPTLLSPAELKQLCDFLCQAFTVTEKTEWTVEANPAELTPEKLDVLEAAGVNRISLGVQSFDEKLLKLLERDHRQPEIHRAIDAIQTRFENFSIDLMFAIPGQSLELWEATLEQALSFHPPHISTYGLTIERGTTFWSRAHKGLLTKPPEEIECEMYRLVIEKLNAAGVNQYEISNFARENFRSQHNQIYWRGKKFYGFGPGAARYVNEHRETNHRSVTTWLKKVHAGENPITDVDVLTPEQKARERIFLGLRMCEGLHLPTFERDTGFNLESLASKELARHLEQGNLEIVNQSLRLTEQGRFIADTIASDFL